MPENDHTKSPAAQTRTLIRDMFHALDRLQHAAVSRGGVRDLTRAIAALKYSHNAIQRATEELTNDHPT